MIEEQGDAEVAFLPPAHPAGDIKASSSSERGEEDVVRARELYVQKCLAMKVK